MMAEAAEYCTEKILSLTKLLFYSSRQTNSVPYFLNAEVETLGL